MTAEMERSDIVFVIVVKYVRPLEEIDALLPAHIEFLKACYARSEFICSGRRNPRVGGIILANVESEQKVWELIKQDPFFIQSVAEYEVLEFIPTRYDERFACFLNDRKEAIQNYVTK